MRRFRRGVAIGALVSAGALVFAACSSNSSGGTTTTQSSKNTTATTVGVKTGGNATMAIDENLAGFNINTSAAALFVLQEILDMVWPQTFITNAALQPILNTQLMNSATQTSTSPQTIVYVINPKAVWQDGKPLDAADYIYNYEAQSGNKAFKDVGGKAFDAASTVGYNQIKSITASNPPNGAACQTVNLGATLGNAVCGNGDTLTVVFSKPFADWRSLFGDIVPQHIASVSGWNTGFSTSSKVLSASWYEIKSYTPNQSLVLQRNPTYWGTPGKLDTITFSFITDDTQEVPALQNNEVNLINPASVSLSIVQNANQVTGINKETIPGLEFEHFDFNEANKYLSKLAVRQAIAYGTDRQQLIQRTVGEFATGINPLGNRMLMPNQPGYVNNGSAYATVNVSKAKSLLSGAGYTMGSDGYFQSGGQDISLRISSTTGNALRQSTEELFQAQMKAIGIKIKIQNYDASTFFGTNLPGGNFDIAEFAWVSTPFLSGNQSIYCSYTNSTNCSSNWNHYAKRDCGHERVQRRAGNQPAD